MPSINYTYSTAQNCTIPHSLTLNILNIGREEMEVDAIKLFYLGLCVKCRCPISHRQAMRWIGGILVLRDVDFSLVECLRLTFFRKTFPLFG